MEPALALPLLGEREGPGAKRREGEGGRRRGADWCSEDQAEPPLSDPNDPRQPESRPVTAILSIQSSVAYGHVGNSAAVFPLQRLGIDVWPVLTVHFSNHTGYGSFRGPVLPADQIAEVLRGVEERGVLPGCDAVLSGYMGDVSLGAVVLDAVSRVKAANPKAIYCCDPVLGDVDRGFFVRPGLPEFMRDHAVPKADIITPNQFELEFLAGLGTGVGDDRAIATLGDALTFAPAWDGMDLIATFSRIIQLPGAHQLRQFSATES